MRTRQAFPIQADNIEGTSSVNPQINNYGNEGNQSHTQINLSPNPLNQENLPYT